MSRGWERDPETYHRFPGPRGPRPIHRDPAEDGEVRYRAEMIRRLSAMERDGMVSIVLDLVILVLVALALMIGWGR